jgi:hypothetical protein
MITALGCIHRPLSHIIHSPVLRKQGFWLEANLAWVLAMSAMDNQSLAVVGDGDSQGSSSKSVVGSFDLKDVPIQWDNDPAIRERMRNGDNLCLAWDGDTGKYVSKYVDPTIENLKVNSAVLKPLVILMGENELRLPSITNLIDAVDELFKLAKLVRTSEHHYQEAWAIRRMIGKLKRFTYRSTPPQDSTTNIHIFSMAAIYMKT